MDSIPHNTDLFIIAGEASGDMHGADLISSIKKIIPDLRIKGIGGPKMEEEGVSMLFPNSDLAVVGLIEVVSHASPIIKAFMKTVSWLKQNRPSLLILIDYPEFNMLVAARAKKIGIPVMYFISPQIWAWRQGRVHRLKRIVDRMVVILPFETEFYHRHGMEAEFVGNPLVDTVKPSQKREEFSDREGFDKKKQLVAVLPGSRRGEIKKLLPVIADSIKKITIDLPEVQFVVPLAPNLNKESMELIDLNVKRLLKNGVMIKTVKDMTWNAVNASDIAIATSGTVTLEAALLGTPSIVIYKLSPISWLLGRYLIKVKYASIINLVANSMILPELLQNKANPEEISSTALELLSDGRRYMQIKKDMAQAVQMLGPSGAMNRAAAIAAEYLV